MDRDVRRTLIVAAALIVALFTGRALISALYDEGDAVRQATTLRTKLRAGGEASSRPARKDMAAASELRDKLSGELSALVPALSYTQPAEFSVGPGESADLRYIEIVRREQELLVKGGAFKGQSVPSNLGLPELNPTGLEDVLRTLRSLHIVHVVVDAGIKSGIEGVDEIRVPPATRKGKADSGFVRQQKVDFELHGSPAAVRHTLATIAGGTPYLALDDVRLERLDDDGAKVRARFSAAALTIDPEQPVQPEASG
jgi:hypothetical protein